MANIVRSACLNFNFKAYFVMPNPSLQKFEGGMYQKGRIGNGSDRTMIIEEANGKRYLLTQVYRSTSKTRNGSPRGGRWVTSSKKETEQHVPSSRFSKKKTKKNNDTLPEGLFSE